MDWLHAREIPNLPVDATLRRITLLFRVLGWAWMAILVVLTPSNDPDANMTIVWSTLALATAWTAVTWWAAIKTDAMGRLWFVAGDVLVTVFVGIAPTIAGARDLFHGGWLNSDLFVIAYAFNVRVTIAAGVFIAIQQVLVHWIDARGVVPAAGSVGFLAIAILVGWAFDQLRLQERRRIATQEELDSALATQVRHRERLDIANRLHDSVLQTLAALRRDADDPGEVRYLARRQERQLRRTISEYRSPYSHSIRAGVEGICDEVEDLYQVAVDAVIRGDAALDTTTEAVLATAREALINAAKHSGAETIDLYAEINSGRVQIFVRDRGRGLAVEPFGQQVELGLQARAQAVGAVVRVASAAGAGTEVEILLEES